MVQWQIFIAFFRVGILGYGGGPSSIPLVHKEVVEKYQWMNEDEFSDILAIGNTLPGPIATKMAGYIGYKVAGILGMLTALFATVIPTVVLLIVLLTTLSSFKEIPWVVGMTNAVVPVVAVLLGLLTINFIVNSQKGLGWTQTIGLAIGSFVIIVLLGIHPGLMIAGILLFVLVYPFERKNKERGRS